VNAQGTVQSFKGTVPGFAQSRPGWKVLRVLGNLLNMPGFDEESSEAVRDTIVASSFQDRLSNAIKGSLDTTILPLQAESTVHPLERVADLPIYRSDAVVRRSASLQATKASQQPLAQVHPDTLKALGLNVGDAVKVKTATGEWLTTVEADQTLPQWAIRVASGFESTSVLGSSTNPLHLERA
jgi:NADH-quinone oxidoreductase subunit G